MQFEPLAHRNPVHDRPPGLLGEIADYIYGCAYRPVREVALCGALGFLAGICGRTYNISQTGLNLYLLCLAPSGSGKEAMVTSIGRLLDAIALTYPDVEKFYGPSHSFNFNALQDAVRRHLSIFSMLSEFGLAFKTMSGSTDGSAAGRRFLLEMFTKSGRLDTSRDVDGKQSKLRSPALTLIAETTPQSFWSRSSPTHLAEGLLPRFLFFIHTDKRPPPNYERLSDPPAELVERLSTLASNCHAVNRAGRHGIEVEETEEARDYLRAYELWCDTRMEGDVTDSRAAWARAHLLALRVAALVAVGVDPNRPVVTMEIAQWAVHLVTYERSQLLTHVGGGVSPEAALQIEQRNSLRVAFENYLRSGWGALSNIKGHATMEKEKIIPGRYLALYPKNQLCFRKHGNASAIRETTDSLVARGEIAIVPIEEQRALGLEHINSGLYRVVGLRKETLPRGKYNKEKDET